MRLLIDGTPLLLHSGGVKNYLYYWLLHLKKLAGPSSIRIFPFLNELGELQHERSTLVPFSTFVGRRRVQQYRWELCAAQSLDSFRELTGL